MRLSKIRLVGFKSFADPTSINLPSNLVGVVGPNGCGKSNIIDSVRWVMGESSAKNLRGDSMEDVIFSGSSSRKPVGRASVELIFDNRDGAIGGEYASYAEISIKRQVSREGQSYYYLNGSRCRRRDITDIFLGTGLGPRSYAIIEQDMVSRLIEAKPAEMRVYIEEAAGISKYKERRQETENRIRYTRDNLDRLSDLREEIDKQIARLKRQARNAERFKELKGEERRLRAELLALRRAEYKAVSTEQLRCVQKRETELEKFVATQRAAELIIERERGAYAESNDRFNAMQGEFYKLGANISRTEQTIQHNRETQRRRQLEYKQLEQAWHQVNQLIAQDREKIDCLTKSIEADTPICQRLLDDQREAAQVLSRAEQAIADWQNDWQDYNRRNAEPVQTAKVERSRIDQFDRLIKQLEQRTAAQNDALDKLDNADLDCQIESLIRAEADAVDRAEKTRAALAQDTRALSALREKQRVCRDELDRARAQVQTTGGRLASLEALQQAAMGEQADRANEWLARRGLSECYRLAEYLDVDTNWELAVETVLEGYLEAVCVDRLPQDFAHFDSGKLTFLDMSMYARSVTDCGATLSDKVRAEIPLPDMLANVRIAGDYAEALSMRGELRPGESVISVDGIWLGPNWLRVNCKREREGGILARQQDLKSLRDTLAQMQTQSVAQEQRFDKIVRELRVAEQRRDATQNTVNKVHRSSVETQSQLNGLRMRQEHIQQNQERLQQDLYDLRKQYQQYCNELKIAKERHTYALQQVEILALEGGRLNDSHIILRDQLDTARRQVRHCSERSQALSIRVESMRTACLATQENLTRAESQCGELEARRATLHTGQPDDDDKSIKAMEAVLKELLTQRLTAERSLAEARKMVQSIESHLRDEEQNRARAEQSTHKVREQLERDRLANQEVCVRIKTLDEQLAESGLNGQDWLECLPEDASATVWVDKIESVGARIQRLGPINLAAIDEYAEQLDRKEYLDKQLTDINQALETLETAIGKIDRETRARFKEMFDKVNDKLQGYFPRLFGGGHASLAMTGNDLLSTGVSVLARPPGKRVSNIHLLSGGEKALTAVALVFAFFEINPAPFCLLDEVDAPLDDANVGRYCELVREMSERVQFIFITHNKATMELSRHLMGVTMYEPGVSRLVSVDVTGAARLAET